jgi:thiosulfate reductase cytochrome b subunit
MVTRQFPHPSEILELMQFKKPEFNAKKRRLDKALTIYDLRTIAKRRTPASAFDYTDGAAEGEISLARARQAFEDVEFHPSILKDASHIDTTTEILGGSSALPFGIAPTGFTRLMQTEGETAGAGAAAATAKAATKAKPKKKREPVEIAGHPLNEILTKGGLALVGLVILAAVVVLVCRWFTHLDPIASWIEDYPGEYEPAHKPAEGFPIWARWQHYLNFFFMALILQSGLRVRQQQKPPAVWQPKKGGKKISINLWLHTSLDLFWMLNGLIFIVLLFVSGHWARIIPTSWEVFPNAVSAALQYASLEWPAENGWTNFNSIQQIMYFLVIFIAAPLAIISGLRMSEWWPKEAKKLNKLYPAPVARQIHFPTMIFFVIFVIIHVFLVFATGMRENLNHMFAGNDSLNWGGFIWFVCGLLVVVGTLFATRPLVLAPVAGKFGTVSAR